MTEPAVETSETPQEEQPWTPFPDEETAQFHADKDVRQLQLHDELEKALDRPVQLSTARTPGEPGEHLWIVPGDVDADIVKQVIAEHEPDPNYGVPQSTRDWFDIQRRVMENPDTELSHEDIQTVLKGLLMRQMGQ